MIHPTEMIQPQIAKNQPPLTELKNESKNPYISIMICSAERSVAIAKVTTTAPESRSKLCFVTRLTIQLICRFLTISESIIN